MFLNYGAQNCKHLLYLFIMFFSFPYLTITIGTHACYLHNMQNPIRLLSFLSCSSPSFHSSFLSRLIPLIFISFIIIGSLSCCQTLRSRKHELYFFTPFLSCIISLSLQYLFSYSSTSSPLFLSFIYLTTLCCFDYENYNTKYQLQIMFKRRTYSILDILICFFR